MSATTSSFEVLLAFLITATHAGCSSNAEDAAKTGSAACAGIGRHVTHLDRDVSFRQEVLPLLQDRCSSASCHGTPGRNGLHLAPSGAAASDVHAALLGVGPKTAMPFVTPGQPDQSWLLKKLDGDFCGVSCIGGCGERMPKRGSPLDPPTMVTIATWIAKGADDN